MSRRQTWSLLLIAFGLFYLVPLSNHGLWIPDETRYAQISQAMLLGGDCVAALPRPALLREAGRRLLDDRPRPGGLGENLFGVRIASVVATALSVLLAYLLARRLWRDPRTSLACALLYASFGLIAGQSGYANLDPQFTFWVNLSLVALWYALDAGSRRARLLGWILLGLACGMGFLTKGFPRLAAAGAGRPALHALAAALARAAWLRRAGGAGGAARLLPWALAVHAREADYWRFFFWHEHPPLRRRRRPALSPVVVLPAVAGGRLPALERPCRALCARPARAAPGAGGLPGAMAAVAAGVLQPEPGQAADLHHALPAAAGTAHGPRPAQRLRLGNSARCAATGLLNLGLALLALAALAYLQLRKPVYQEEPFELFLVLLVIGAWAAAGPPSGATRYAPAPLLASWVLIALLPAAMPNHVVQNKTPTCSSPNTSTNWPAPAIC